MHLPFFWSRTERRLNKRVLFTFQPPSDMDSDKWQVVSKKKAMKKSAGIKEQKLSKSDGSLKSLYCDLDGKPDEVIKKILSTMRIMRNSDFWASCKGYLYKCQNLVSAVRKDNQDKEDLMKNHGLKEPASLCQSLRHCDCVCYGLGNFSSCVVSRHQLAFLLLFLEQFKISYLHCYVYDPAFSSLEISVLKELALSVKSKNEEGKHVVQKPTVFYMVHCGKALYNNLLWRNWSTEALSQMIIIGNSFQGVEEQLLSRILQRDYAYIYKSLQVVEESSLPECPEYSDVFNNTAIHSFPITKLQALPEDIWLPQEEPQYPDCDDLEIIRNLAI